MVKSTKKGESQANRQKKKKVADKVKGSGSKAPASKAARVSARKGGKTKESQKKRKTAPSDNDIGIQKERKSVIKKTRRTDLEVVVANTATSSSEENDDEDSSDQDSNTSTESESNEDNSSTSVNVNDTMAGVDSNESKPTSGEQKNSKVKVEESFVVRDNKGIDMYVKKNNKLNEDDMIEKKHYQKTINYLLNKKSTAEKELIKLTTIHSVDIKAKAVKHLNEKMVEYVNQVLAINSLRYEIMYPTATVNMQSCLCFRFSYRFYSYISNKFDLFFLSV